MISVITEITDESVRRHPSRRLLAFPLPFAPSLAVLLAQPFLTPWLFMWASAAALFFAFKWLSWRARQPTRTSFSTMVAYLFLWPGMDPGPFLSPAAPVANRRGWIWPLAHVFAGAACLGLALSASPGSLVTGWVAMTGLVLLLHFGCFGLLAWAWQTRGIPVEPIMQSPVRSQSLGEFWGKRWNRAFSDFSRKFIFYPVARRSNAHLGWLSVFFISGLIHELVISLPARAGLGLPTAYFLLQGLGIGVQRSAWGRRVGLGRGWIGRLFTLSIIVVPAFWLFHPPFVRTVILPMLQAWR